MGLALNYWLEQSTISLLSQRCNVWKVGRQVAPSSHSGYMSRSRRRRSPSPAKPHHAGVAYRMDATVVALATRWSSCGWRPWVRRSLNANIEEEQVFKTCETWSVMVNLALRWTPRTLSVALNMSVSCSITPVQSPPVLHRSLVPLLLWKG